MMRRPWERGCPPFLWFVRRAATSTYLRSVGRRGFNLEGWGGMAVAGFHSLGCASPWRTLRRGGRGGCSAIRPTMVWAVVDLCLACAPICAWCGRHSARGGGWVGYLSAIRPTMGGRWSVFGWRVRPSAQGVAGIPARRRSLGVPRLLAGRRAGFTPAARRGVQRRLS